MKFAEFQRYAPLSAKQISQLQAHYDLLVRWNAKLNLTRIESPEQAELLHYCESLYLGAVLPPGALNIADIGTGAGFPGIPIAILRPDSQITLVESHQRKAVFLREATRDLPNVKVVAGRAQDLSGPFDWVVSRAVTPSEVLELPISQHFAVLVGPEDSAKLGGFPLPWGEGRNLASVPRGTISPLIPLA
ncbi:MAG: 16S rRNA (guanine(527)-N(7))-methyltransferase RsmG [Bryobacteraceae bacterium]